MVAPTFVVNSETAVWRPGSGDWMFAGTGTVSL
jgi:hypothetical protein